MAQRRRLPALLTATLLVVLAAPSGTAAADPPPGFPSRARAATAARDALADPPTSLIVTYRAGVGAARSSAIRASERLDSIASLRSIRAEVVRPRGKTLAAALESLRRHPDVAAVQPNHRRARAADPTGETYWPLQWGHHNVGQVVGGFAGVGDADVDGLEALGVGAGSPSVVVAVIDDGVDLGHPDLAGSAWVNPGESGPDGLGGDRATNGLDDDLNGYADDVNGWDFCDDDNTVHDPGDDWHGTAVAGAIAAQINGVGVAGIAPATRIMGLKFISDVSSNPDCNSDTLAIQAIEYAAGFGVRVINASWGGPAASPALEAAIVASGALFVTAAGNGGPDGVGDNNDTTPDYPSSFGAANILSVAAIHNEGALSTFSNFGLATVDMSAPGEDIALPLPASNPVCVAQWCLISGTSFSSPYVAGIAALVGAADPALLASPTALRTRILATGTPLASTSGKTATGRLANARAAVDFTPPGAGARPTALPLVVGQLGTGSGTVRLRVTWPAATEDTDQLAYRLERRRNGGAWTVVAAATPKRHADLTIGISGLNEFRVQPRDGGLNVGAWSPVVGFTPVLYQETTTLAKRTGTWRSYANTFASGGRTLYTTVSGASMTLTFTGRAVALVAPRGPTRSSFKVYLDGAFVATVSLYSATSQSRQVLFTTGFLASGKHTLRLVNTRVGSRSRGEVDGFVVLR